MKFHFVVTFCSEVVGRSAHTEIPSTPQELSSLMNRKIIRLAAKKLSEVDRATLDNFRDSRDMHAIIDDSPAYRVATFLSLTI